MNSCNQLILMLMVWFTLCLLMPQTWMWMEMSTRWSHDLTVNVWPSPKWMCQMAVLYSRIGSVKYTPLSRNGLIGDKELESQIFFHNIFILITTLIHGSKNTAIASINRTRALLESDLLSNWSKHRHLSSYVFQHPHPSGRLAPSLTFLFDAHRQRAQERERAKKALNYKGFWNSKLRLGCSNIQGPRPCDLRLTSSKALIYYYY